MVVRGRGIRLPQLEVVVPRKSSFKTPGPTIHPEGPVHQHYPIVVDQGLPSRIHPMNSLQECSIRKQEEVQILKRQREGAKYLR